MILPFRPWNTGEPSIACSFTPEPCISVPCTISLGRMKVLGTLPSLRHLENIANCIRNPTSSRLPSSALLIASLALLRMFPN
ncbi:hypothetical protein FA13DRAFT_1729885 [Coprinellus micaceus]|uniref:Uncharacterized protein n=1 Tax=Coprinellus micaceus TaxID=71717 RepID=A0A4Y7TLI9_COPMI|nr:hypothetical protein FA13DRAFT_1729885 [Coprinellus micaceus]